IRTDPPVNAGETESAIEGVNTLTEPLDTPDLPIMPTGQPEPDLSSDAMGVTDIPALETPPAGENGVSIPPSSGTEPLAVPPPVAPIDSTGAGGAAAAPENTAAAALPTPELYGSNTPPADVTVNLEQPDPEKIDPQSPDSYYYYGTAEKQAGKQATATTTAPAPTTPPSTLTSRSDPTQAKSEYNEAYRLLVNDPAQAIPAFRAFLNKYPDHELAANAQYWLGEALYAQKDFAAASDEFMQVLKLHKDSPKAPGAALKLGYSFYELENWEFARRTLEDTIRFFPDSNSATLAGERLKMMESAGR
ncbi:MAG TPA: tol-pal system protein YbgF, partial [Thiolinea sp.]|nr:tol-pal system protein YbgF [Thiolinea sp.]